MKLLPRFPMIAAALLAAGPVRANDPDAPLDLKPTSAVDERLFVLHAAGHLLNTWTPGTTDRAAVRGWLDHRAAVLDRLTARAKAATLDDELITFLGELRKLTGRHEAFLANAGLIERRAAGQHAMDSFETGYNAGKLGSDLYDAARRSGADRGDSAAAAVVVSGIAALFEADDRERKRNAARDAAVRAEQRAFESAFTTAQASGRAAAQALGRRYSWADGRAGHDDYKSDSMSEHLRRRPEDPFARVQNANIRTAGEGAATFLSDARACVAAARLIPSDPAYDTFRALCLESASELATQAVHREWTADPAHKYPTASAAEAVRIVRTRLQYPDPTDLGKYELAQVLNMAGRHADAVRAASSARKQHNTSGFAYNYACLLSLNGDADRALEWLAYSFRLGGTSVSWAKRDPDLAIMRRERAAAFDKLVDVSTTWRINFGVFDDDIVVTNNSAFALTNVELIPTIVRNGRTYTKTLRVAYLAAGQSYTWEDAFSIPDSRADSSSATLSCDQQK